MSKFLYCESSDVLVAMDMVESFYLDADSEVLGLGVVYCKVVGGEEYEMFTCGVNEWVEKVYMYLFNKAGE